MTLKQQSNLLAWLAALAVAAVLSVSWLSLHQVRQQTAQITTAEDTAKGVAQFRYLIMEAALYHEPRSLEQWKRHVASFRVALAEHHYTTAASNGLLQREREQLDILARQFERLAATSKDYPELLASNVSALFLTTQDMGDDAYELMRLERQQLEEAQQMAARLMLLSIAVLTVLLVGASVIIRRRVLAPIALLQAGMEQVGAGQLGRRVDLRVENEIGALGTVFDTMSAQLQQSRDALAADDAVRRQAQAELLDTVQALARKSDELSQAQSDLQSIIDHTPALVVYWDRELINRFGNRAYFDWFGITPEQMKGRHMREIIGEERFATLAPQMAQVMRGVPQVFEGVIDYAGGQQRHALFSYFPDLQDGQVKGCYGFVSDITQLKQAQAARTEALERLQNVVDAASDFAIVATNVAGSITLFSKGAELMTGYAAHEVVGKATPALLHVAGEVQARGAALTAIQGRRIEGFDVFVDMARQSGSESRDWTYRRKDGSTLPVNMTVTAMRDPHGMVTGFLAIAKDIRHEQEVRRILAEARDEAESANTAKTHFLANMSHEIRTPMNAILGMLRLQRQTPLSPQQLDYATKAESAATSLLGLLNDILDVSRLEAHKMTLERAPFRIDALVRDITPMLTALASGKQLRVVTLVDPALPLVVEGDMMRLRQVLLNLAGNAIKFTNEGEVELAVDACGDNIVGFTVRDTGIGITPEQCATIFDGFSQAEASTSRRFGGSGLGLTISQHLVSLMGGTLEVDSTPSVGSCFSFRARLPAASLQALPAPPRKPARSAARRLEGLRLLVVDDNALNQQVARELLAFEGAVVDVASGGVEGVRMVLDALPPYHAVLMDVQMPDQDGYESTRILRRRAHLKTLPIIAMTANTMAGDRELSLAAGMDDHVGKPIDIDALVMTLLDQCRPAMPAPPLSAPAPLPPPAPVPAVPAPGCIEVDRALARLGGNRQLYESLARTFSGEARTLMGRLETALAAGRMTEAGNVLHTFRSAAGIVGASQLDVFTFEAEQSLRAPGAQLDAQAVATLLAKAGNLTAQALAELDRMLETAKA
jgi:PAS domain S-box-containing protein